MTSVLKIKTNGALVGARVMLRIFFLTLQRAFVCICVPTLVQLIDIDIFCAFGAKQHQRASCKKKKISHSL